MNNLHLINALLILFGTIVVELLMILGLKSILLAKKTDLNHLCLVIIGMNCITLYFIYDPKLYVHPNFDDSLVAIVIASILIQFAMRYRASRALTISTCLHMAPLFIASYFLGRVNWTSLFLSPKSVVSLQSYAESHHILVVYWWIVTVGLLVGTGIVWWVRTRTHPLYMPDTPHFTRVLLHRSPEKKQHT